MFNNLVNYAKKPKTFTLILLTILPVFICVTVFFILNMLTPVWWDDFIMACYFTNWYDPHTSLLSSFSDVVNSTYNMYNTWHGRVVANFLNFLFMYFKNKTIFNICNTIVYYIFVMLIGFHAVGSFKKISGFQFMFINIFLWLFLSTWGQNLLWLTGSFNYLWTSTLVLLFIIPFRKKLADKSYKPHIIISILWVITGVFAGCSMENSSSGVLILLFSYFIYKKIKKEKVEIFEITGSIGFLTGYIILINARRDDFPGIFEILKNTLIVGFEFIMNDAFIIGAIVLLAINLIYYKKNRLNIESYAYFIASLGSAAAMVIRGRYEGRAIFITQIFLIITLLSLLKQYKRHIYEKRYVLYAGILLFLLFIPSFYRGSIEIAENFLFVKAREYYIETEKSKGNADIKVKTPILVKDSHSALYGTQSYDVLDNPFDEEYIAHNTAKATWYEIDSITGIPTTIKRLNIFMFIKKYFSLRKKENLEINDLYRIVYEDW